MPKISYIKSMLLSSANEKQDDGEGSTSEVDESIEVEVGLIASCASSTSDASHEHIGSVTVLNSEARSDRNVEVDPTLDKRDGVCVHSRKEETIVIVETAQGINNLAANIEDKNNESVDETSALKSILNEQLRLVMAEIDDLDHLKNQNVDSSIKANVQEINLHEQIMMDALTVEMNNRNKLLGKQSVQIALLTEQLHNSMDTNEELEAKFLSFVVGNKENVQQMSALEDELTDKMNMIDEMSADIEHKNELLKEQSKEIALLLLSKAESVGLKTAVESLIASNCNSVEQIFVFEDDLGTMKTKMDKISEDIQTKSILLEEKTIENIGLTEQLQSKTAENANLVAEVQTLLATNMEKVLQISQLGDNLAAKTMSAMLDLVTSNEENAQIISILGEEVAEKNFMIEKMNQDIVQLSTKCADLTEQLQRSTAMNEEFDSEVKSLVTNSKLFKAKNDRLEGEVQTLVANNKENVKQRSLLDDELEAAKTVMAESIAEINSKNELFEERSVEMAELSEQLAISSTKTIELEAEIANLSERLEVAMTKIGWFEEYVESLVANSKENTHRIFVLENQVTAKNITIDQMTADIDNLRSTHSEIVAEYNELDEKFTLVETERDGLNKSVHDLEKTKSKYASKIVTLQRGVKDVIDANGKLKEAKKSIKMQNAELLDMVNCMTKSLDVERSEMEGMNKILESEKALTDAIISTMQNEANDLTDRLQLLKTERDNFEKAVQTLMASNTESLQQKTLIEDDLTAKKIMIDEITASLEVKSAENTELTKQLQLLLAKHDLFKTEVRSLIARTKVDLATKMIMIDKLTISLEEKSTENTVLAEELKQFKVKTDVFKADVQTLVALTKENVMQMSALEVELMVKKSMIGEISQEVKNLNMMCESMTAEITSSNEQVDLFKAECLGFKARIEDLESNITYYVKEVLNLALSLELAVDKVSTTDDELSQVTYSLYIERPNHNMQLHEMKKGLEHSVRKCEAKITEQKGTLDDLSKSLDTARVEIRNKNAVLDEKTSQIKEYLDVVEQVHLSDCGIGVGNFWNSAE